MEICFILTNHVILYFVYKKCRSRSDIPRDYFLKAFHSYFKSAIFGLSHNTYHLASRNDFSTTSEPSTPLIQYPLPFVESQMF